MVKDKCCLICNVSVSLPKKKKKVIWNAIIVLTIAISMMLIFAPKSEIRKLKLRELKSKLDAQQQLMAKPMSLCNNATI
jgi:hypothetical protein